jgi:hypothetical protein
MDKALDAWREVAANPAEAFPWGPPNNWYDAIV